jgi:hypothetical protein
MKTWVNDNGTPRELSKIWVDDNGVVRQLTKLWAVSGGVVRQIYGSVYTYLAELIPNDVGSIQNYGISNGISGSTVVFGMAGGGTTQGAYVFTGSGSTWTQQQKIVGSDTVAGDRFAQRVAIDGDTIVVGAMLEDSGSTTDQGAVYVFVRSGGVWTQQQKLLASDAISEDWFGYSVGISGNTIVVGAMNEDSGSTLNQGAVYVFTRSGTTWTQQQKLLASDAATNDLFSGSVVNVVSIDGDTLAVGVREEDSGSTTDQGAVYVFVRSGGVWTQQQKLLASDGASNDFFGSSVSLHRNTLIVGAPREDTSPNTNNGAVYVFTRSGSTWTQQQKLLSSAPGNNLLFGNDVATDSDSIIVAGYGWFEIFNKTTGTFVQTRRVQVPINDTIGTTVSFDKSTQRIVVSDITGVTGTGSVRVYPV